MIKGIETRHIVPLPARGRAGGRALLEAGMEVHRSLGPGFIEHIYEEALCHELTLRGVSFERQKTIQVFTRMCHLASSALTW